MQKTKSRSAIFTKRRNSPPKPIKKRENTAVEEVAPGLSRIAHRIVNTYLVSDAESGTWVLVDAGLPTSARRIFKVAEQRFGRKTRPAAILLTHGHFDHVGSLRKLLKRWDVPVYVHRLELPYLTGRSDYPPGDPRVGGGLMTLMCRFFLRKGIDLGHRGKPLPSDGAGPHLAGWRWLHTPGTSAV